MISIFKFKKQQSKKSSVQQVASLEELRSLETSIHIPTTFIITAARTSNPTKPEIDGNMRII
jgi:hypothetical protein